LTIALYRAKIDTLFEHSPKEPPIKRELAKEFLFSEVKNKKIPLHSKSGGNSPRNIKHCTRGNRQNK